jgi:membrane-associated phospholipid phosphatase
MPDASSAESGYSFIGRLKAIWELKAAATIGVSVVFWSGYLYLSRHAFFSLHELPLTPLDTWAGYHPHPWAWIYESIFLLTGIIPWLVVTRNQMQRYLTGFALLALTSFAIFAVFPVASPRPLHSEPTPFLLFITHVDGPFNAFPSLHAGCLIYNLCLAYRLFKNPVHPLIPPALGVWALMILFGTLATKQHYALDLVAGAVLGWLADWAAWRSPARELNAAENTRRNSSVTSQAG